MEPSTLTTQQKLQSAGLGAFLWALGIPLLKYLSQTAMVDIYGIKMMGCYALQLPVAYATMQTIQYLFKPKNRQERLELTAIACATACLTDGVALVYFPGQTYGNDNVLLPRVGAALLTGIGTLLGLTTLM